MEVTQQEINNSILLIDKSIALLATKASATLKTGCQPCEDLFNEYNKLRVYKYLLQQGFTAVNLGCITENDLWNAVQFVKQNTCGFPDLAGEEYSWLVTNYGFDILTNELMKIKTT